MRLQGGYQLCWRRYNCDSMREGLQGQNKPEVPVLRDALDGFLSFCLRLFFEKHHVSALLRTCEDRGQGLGGRSLMQPGINKLLQCLHSEASGNDVATGRHLCNKT